MKDVVTVWIKLADKLKGHVVNTDGETVWLLKHPFCSNLAEDPAKPPRSKHHPVLGATGKPFCAQGILCLLLVHRQGQESDILIYI